LRVGHVFLLGDSIFDNAAYVARGSSVIEHLHRALPSGWQATLLAVDGAIIADVRDQLGGLDQSATHLFLSAGGNDANYASGILAQAVQTVGGAADLLAKVQGQFRHNYQELLGEILALAKPLAVCTIYDAIPGLTAAQRAALALFNDVIHRSALEAGAAVIDLRLVCTEADDYSAISPIEPSGQGAAKIARVIAHVAAAAPSSSGAGRVYW
jgi:hypothetical protein